jgi:hypothetical protein
VLAQATYPRAGGQETQPGNRLQDNNTHFLFMETCPGWHDALRSRIASDITMMTFPHRSADKPNTRWWGVLTRKKAIWTRRRNQIVPRLGKLMFCIELIRRRVDFSHEDFTPGRRARSEEESPTPRLRIRTSWHSCSR